MRTLLKTTLKMVVATAIQAVVAVSAQAQEPDFDQVEVTSQKVKGKIYMLQGAGGNIGLSVGKDATFIIDDQYAPLTEKIVAAIAKITDRPVDIVFNTHWHGDHAGGNENLGKMGARIVAHENVRKRLSEGLESVLRQTKIKPAPKEALPVITFPDEMTFYLNGEEMRVFHLENAHTDGDAVVHFIDSNVLHTGDLFFNGRYPFIDPESGGHIDGVIAAQNALLDLVDDNTRIIPGHGPLANKADLLKARDMLVDVRDRIRTLVDESKTMEEAIAAKPLADLDADYVPEGGFLTGEVLTRLVYMMLADGEDVAE